MDRDYVVMYQCYLSLMQYCSGNGDGVVQREEVVVLIMRCGGSQPVLEDQRFPRRCIGVVGYHWFCVYWIVGAISMIFCC